MIEKTFSTDDLKWSFAPLTEFDAHAPAWDAVNQQAGGLPFMQSLFIRPLLRHSGLAEGLIAIGHSRGQPVAATLLVKAGIGRMATLQPSQLPLGAWLVPAHAKGEQIANSLLRCLPARCVALGVTQLDPLLSPRPVDGPRVRTIYYIQTGWIEVNGHFDDFWEARGKNLRSNLKKQRNKLAAQGTPLVFDRVRSPADVEAAMAHFSRLESAGWKADLGTAVSTDSAQGRFYTEMMETFCAAGLGQIWTLRLGDQVVAADLCIQSQGTLVILKTAYDPEYRSVSPAFLLKQEAFEQIFREGEVKRIEFYGRLMEWHTRWTEQARGLYHLNLYRWNWVPRLRDWRRRAPSDAVASEPAAAVT